jgi:hypothetical protein
MSKKYWSALIRIYARYEDIEELMQLQTRLLNDTDLVLKEFNLELIAEDDQTD